jgi:hypothetical protein
MEWIISCSPSTGVRSDHWEHCLGHVGGHLVAILAFLAIFSFSYCRGAPLDSANFWLDHDVILGHLGYLGQFRVNLAGIFGVSSHFEACFGPPMAHDGLRRQRRTTPTLMCVSPWFSFRCHLRYCAPGSCWQLDCSSLLSGNGIAMGGLE